MSELIILLVIFTIPATLTLIKNILLHTYTWQTKEFRIDRMLAYLRYEKNFYDVSNSITLIKGVLLASLGCYLYTIEGGTNLLGFATIVTFIIYLFEAEGVIKGVIYRDLIRPKLKSIRTLMIVCGTIAIVGIGIGVFFYWLMQFRPIDLPKGFELTEYSFSREILEDQFLARNESIPLPNLLITINAFLVLLMDLCLPVIVSLFVIVTEPLALITRQRTINAAIAKHKKNPNLKIVGITGSYGKSTTKELLYQLLKPHFKVAKTEKNQNTVVGIAMSYIKNVHNNTEVFVMEVGAYVAGEIGRVVKNFQPDIAIVTAVSNQHLSLFGSLSALFYAKFELVQGLKPLGVAIFNADDSNCIKMSQKTNKRKFFYGRLPDNDMELPKTKITIKDQELTSNVYLRNTERTKKGSKAEIVYLDKSYTIDTNIKIVGFLQNLLAAFAAAVELGVPVKDLIKTINEADFDLPYFKETKGKLGEKIIDDGKTANVNGFLLAIGVISEEEIKQSGKKWIITQGIIELGNEKRKNYAKIADKCKDSIDGIITTDKDLVEILENRDFLGNVIYIKNSKSLQSYYQANIKAGDIVLLEGNLPPKFINEIK